MNNKGFISVGIVLIVLILIGILGFCVMPMLPARNMPGKVEMRTLYARTASL